MISIVLGCASDTDGAGVDPLATSEVERWTRAMTDIGPRMVGTPEEELARDVVIDLFELAGAEVDVHPFSWDAWQPGPGTISVGDDVVEAWPLSPSPATELQLELATSEFDGKAWIASDRTGGRADHFLEATFGGAEALIRVTELGSREGNLPLVEVGHLLEGSELPAVGVDFESGALLRSHTGEVATIDLSPSILPGHVSHNVLGRVEGTSEAAPVVVVAHYDSWHPSESAFDNALGIGAMVALMRKLQEEGPPERDVLFLATSAEEQGLQGAIAWVEDNLDEALATSLVLVLDVLWSGEGTYFILASDETWMERALMAAEDHGLDAVDGGDPGIGSDHFPFVTRGIPAIWCGRWSDRHYHTVEDRLVHLDLDKAAAATRHQWDLLSQAAGL